MILYNSESYFDICNKLTCWIILQYRRKVVLLFIQINNLHISINIFLVAKTISSCRIYIQYALSICAILFMD